MSMRGIIRSAAAITVIYGIAKVGEIVGLFKGVVKGCRIAQQYPEDAAKIVADADYLKARIKRSCKEA